MTQAENFKNQPHLELSLAHLYPEQLNLYGDFGNILAFKHIATKKGVNINYHPIKMESSSELDDFDIFFMGGGQDHEQDKLIDDFINKKGPSLIRQFEQNKVFLGICGAYQLLGQGFVTNDNKFLKGLDYFPLITEGGTSRLIGDIVSETSLFEGEDRFLIGFENHSGLTRKISSDSEKKEGDFLAKIIVGKGNNGEDSYEGFRKNNVFGTYCHGSFLPKNPAMTNLLLNLALERKYGKKYLEDINFQFVVKDERALLVRSSLLKKLGVKF